jgi:hypothetical protein
MSGQLLALTALPPVHCTHWIRGCAGVGVDAQHIREKSITLSGIELWSSST